MGRKVKSELTRRTPTCVLIAALVGCALGMDPDAAEKPFLLFSLAAVIMVSAII